jgi:hypothetical protein
MKRLIIFLLLFAAIKVAGQTTGYLRFDTVKIMKQNGTCELYIINKTKDSLGLLTNVGGGLTRFIKSRANGDTLFVGLDTLIVEASAGNLNSGTAYRWLNEGTQEIKTVADSWGIKWDSTSAANALTAKPDTGASGVATQYDLTQIAIPTLQQVTDAGQVTNDSVRIRTVNLDSSLYLAVRRAADTVAMAQRRGLIMYDSTSGSVWLRGENFWTAFASLSNSLIPNRPNMRLIAVILRPTVSGGTVTWNAIVDSEHDSIGVGTISCSGGNIVVPLQPSPAAKIHTILIAPDESLMGIIDAGISFQPTQALVSIRRRVGTHNAKLIGNGTTYAVTGDATINYTAATGNLLIDWISAYTPPSSGTAVTYRGSNGYNVEKQESGLSGNDRRYIVKDMFGNVVTANPTTSDIIEIVTADWKYASIDACVAGGDGFAAATFTAFSNFWIIGLVEY